MSPCGARHLVPTILLLSAGCSVESHRLGYVAEGQHQADTDNSLQRDGGARSSGNDASSSDRDAGTDAARSEDVNVEAPDCAGEEGKLHESLACTGLYDDIVDKTLADGVITYAPALPLWSDGAEKQRWIWIPPGEKIDTSKLEEWSFPVGTRVWKEFRVHGKRVETRLFWKYRSNIWRHGTYLWNEDETAAEYTFGGMDVPVEGGSYYVPEWGECNDCHEGQKDRLLGFDAISLGLPGATGITLSQLAEEGLLTDIPERLELELGDDGTGAAQALGVLHINCGVSCHNQGPNSEGNLTGLELLLEPAMLDGRPPDETWPVMRTALNTPAKGPAWGRVIRVVPGAPDESLIVQVMATRSDSDAQMPPIATRVVDEEGLALVRKWIAALPTD